MKDRSASNEEALAGIKVGNHGGWALVVRTVELFRLKIYFGRPALVEGKIRQRLIRMNL